MPRSVAVPNAPCAPVHVPTVRSTKGCQIELIDSLQALQHIVPAWATLWRQISSTPFQSPHWIIPFIQCFSVEKLRVLAMRDHTQLVALAPFYIFDDHATGLRKLLLLGSGLSDYLDILVRPHYEETCFRFVRQFFTNNRHEWDECHFTQIPSDSLLRRVGPNTPGIPCLTLSLHEKSDSNYAPLRQLDKLRYYRRRAAKEGHLQFLRADSANCDAIMENLIDLHRARWAELQQDGVLNDPRVCEFHLEAARRMADAEMLRLYSAQLDDVTIAVLYAFSSHARTAYYISGFDPNYEKLSPGTLLIGHAIEQALLEHNDSFNFLRGQEKYKYAWGATGHPTWNILEAMG